MTTEFWNWRCSFADSIVVTGDKHLLKLGRYEHVEIMTVNEFIALEARPVR